MEEEEDYYEYEEEEEEEGDDYYWYDYEHNYDDYSKPDWFTALVFLQVDLIQNALSFLFSPVVFLISLLSRSYRKAKRAADSVQSALLGAPFAAAHGVAVLLRKLGFAVFGAACVCVVLSVVLVVAIVLGVGLVRMWVHDEPVVVKEKLLFDYTEANPRAEFWFESPNSHNIGVPIGHTFSVSVTILMPESHFNRHIGVFQISAELLSSNGHVMAKSTLPCMLGFTSLPVRLARTFVMSVPILLGLTGETQTLTLAKILKHKEGTLRTKGVRVTMSPRAGTTLLPQIYGAGIVLKSSLPWHKELVRCWKWTFYVWSSLYIFVILVIALLCFCKTVFFPLSKSSVIQHRTMLSFSSNDDDDDGYYRDTEEEEEEFSEYLRKWQLRRNKRNEISSEVGSTLTLTREDSSSSSITIEGLEDEGDDLGRL